MSSSATGMAPTSGQNAQGQYVRGWDVHFETGAGHRGTVFVPASLYRPDVVKAMIAPVAGALDAVGNLTS